MDKLQDENLVEFTEHHSDNTDNVTIITSNIFNENISSREDEYDFSENNSSDSEYFSINEYFSGASEQESLVEDIGEQEKNDNKNSSNPILSQLRFWAIENQIHQTKLDKLFKILKPLIPELPACSKTFLKSTEKSIYTIENINGINENVEGDFVYFGIAEQLRKTVNPDIHEDGILQIQFHVDGLSLFKSSNKEFCPILGKVFFNPDIYKPFNIATYYCVGKPKSAKNYCKNF